MNMREYQQAAQATAGGDNRIERSVLGLVGEAGEVAEKRKKFLRGDFGAGDEAVQAYEFSIIDELGDVLWYLAECALQHGWNLDEVAQHNLNKLADRAERGVIQGEGDDR